MINKITGLSSLRTRGARKRAVFVIAMKFLNMLLLMSFVSVLSFAADLPAWTKGGKSSKYPPEQFLTAVGKGADEKEAVADAQKNIIKDVTDMLASNGIEKAKINISPVTLLKSFEKGYTYDDKENKTFYVYGVADRNMIRINIEDDLYAAEQALNYRSAIYETSNFTVIPKIKAINELLELYDRRDSINTLKKALTGSIINLPEVGEFEREKLETERKKLFENIVYYVKAESFNTAKLVKFLAEREYDVLSELPSRPVSGDKGVVVINCKVQVNKTQAKDAGSYDWIADLVLDDAFNEHTVLYSKTSAGDESGNDDAEAASKAASAAETEMNRMTQEFFKTAEKM
ncbi:MAG: hypothetical protein FWH43_06135 [Endomicrobia bacterium]|nr:hypothetical protein [Endomicrobiia bacterium]